LMHCIGIHTLTYIEQEIVVKTHDNQPAFYDTNNTLNAAAATVVNNRIHECFGICFVH
jgi:hypothetical protein